VLSVGDDPWQPLAAQPGVAAVADRQRADRFAHPVGLDRTIVLAARHAAAGVPGLAETLGQERRIV
jgi:hypothetical protein